MNLGMVVGSNPSTVYTMDIFHRNFLANLEVCLEKTENKLKRGRGRPIKNNATFTLLFIKTWSFLQKVLYLEKPPASA